MTSLVNSTKYLDKSISSTKIQEIEAGIFLNSFHEHITVIPDQTYIHSYTKDYYFS